MLICNGPEILRAIRKALGEAASTEPITVTFTAGNAFVLIVADDENLNVMAKDQVTLISRV